MKCRFCNREAVLLERRSKTPVCKIHFNRMVERNVFRALLRYDIVRCKEKFVIIETPWNKNEVKLISRLLERSAKKRGCERGEVVKVRGEDIGLTLRSAWVGRKGNVVIPLTRDKVLALILYFMFYDKTLGLAESYPKYYAKETVIQNPAYDLHSYDVAMYLGEEYEPIRPFKPAALWELWNEIVWNQVSEVFSSVKVLDHLVKELKKCKVCGAPSAEEICIYCLTRLNKASNTAANATGT